MIDVFVESNWVFDYCAPRHKRSRDAIDLVSLVQAKRVRLHIPSICLREGAESVRRKCQARTGDPAVYRKLAVAEGHVSKEDSKVIVSFFNQYQKDVRADLNGIDQRLDELQAEEGIEAFALDEDMLNQVLALRHLPDVQQLKPFDEAILAAVLVGSARLRDEGENDVRFFTKDSDLWPWLPKHGGVRTDLKTLYDDANVWVQSDYNTTVANPLV